jgi:hypothetical protein
MEFQSVISIASVFGGKNSNDTVVLFVFSCLSDISMTYAAASSLSASVATESSHTGFFAGTKCGAARRRAAAALHSARER